MSDCGCVYVDYDPIETMDSKSIVARKAHKCTECARVIKKGERHEYVRGKFGGRIVSYRTCADCQSIIDSFFCDGWGYTVVHDDLRVHICEMDGEIASSCITPLTERAKDVVLGMIQDVFDDRNAAEGKEPTP